MCKSLKSIKTTLFSYSITKINHSRCFDHQSKLEVIKACECSIRKTKRRKRRERERERERESSMLVRRWPPRHVGSHLWPRGVLVCGRLAGWAWIWGGLLVGLRCWLGSALTTRWSPAWSKSEKPSHTVTSLQAMVLCWLGDGESGSLWASIGERGCLWGLPIIAGCHVWSCKRDGAVGWAANGLSCDGVRREIGVKGVQPMEGGHGYCHHCGRLLPWCMAVRRPMVGVYFTIFF